jgi:predicted small lipoprotein YifL
VTRMRATGWLVFAAALLSADFLCGQEQPLPLPPSDHPPMVSMPTDSAPAAGSHEAPTLTIERNDGSGGLDDFGGRGMGGAGRGRGPSYSATWYASATVSGQDADLGLIRQNLSGRHATLDVNAGYAFDRYFGEGRNSGATLHDRVDVAPGAFLGATFRVRF